MPDLGYPVVVVVLGGIAVLSLWRSGVFTPRAVTAWTRIGRNNHLPDERRLDERLAERVPSLARFFRETSVPRLLSIAHRRESLNTWLVKVAIYVLVAGIALLMLDSVVGIRNGSVPLPPVVCLLGAARFVPLSYLTLRSEARRRQEAINRSVVQSLSDTASLAFTGQCPVSSALAVVGRRQP